MAESLAELLAEALHEADCGCGQLTAHEPHEDEDFPYSLDAAFIGKVLFDNPAKVLGWMADEGLIEQFGMSSRGVVYVLREKSDG